MSTPIERMTDGGSVVLTPCISCRHATPGMNTCTAFPAGIPWPIIRGDNNHRRPYPGDNGIQYSRSPAHATDGPVMASVFLGMDGEWIAAAWMGDDGTVGVIPRDPDNTDWDWRLRSAIQHGTSPLEFIRYWQESMPNSTALARYEGVDQLRASLPS